MTNEHTEICIFYILWKTLLGYGGLCLVYKKSLANTLGKFEHTVTHTRQNKFESEWEEYITCIYNNHQLKKYIVLYRQMLGSQ